MKSVPFSFLFFSYQTIGEDKAKGHFVEAVRYIAKIKELIN
jgi:hypothetical protein